MKRTIIILLCTLTMFSCQIVYGSEDKTSLADRTVDFEVDDLQPLYLNEDRTVSHNPELRFEEEFHLKDGDGNNVQNIVLLSRANGIFYVFDFNLKEVQLFDSDGKYLSAITHPDFKDKCMPFSVAAYSRALKRVVASVPGKGLYLFQETGEFDQALTFSETKYFKEGILGVIPSKTGDLLAVTLYVRGPYLGLIRDRSLYRQFYKDRTPLIAAADDFRSNFWPLVHVDSDQEGNLYTCERVDYEIRKYSPNGDYIGDFRVIKDSNYSPPPERLDRDQYRTDKEFREKWENSWAQVDSLGVLNDEYLVVCLETHRHPGYSLHFYTLDGGACDHPVAWFGRLMCVDEDSRMYFLDESAKEPLLSVWSIESKSESENSDTE